MSCRAALERLAGRDAGRPSAVRDDALDAHLAACAACRAKAEGLERAAARLQTYRPLPLDFSDAVLRRVRRPSPALRPAVPWGWRQLPAAAGLAAAVALGAAGVWNVSRTAPVGPPTVKIELELEAVDAHQVAVAGDFNGWAADGARMTRGEDGVWRIRLELPPGRYQYAFVVDDDRWIADPRAETVVDNGYSGSNSVLDVSL